MRGKLIHEEKRMTFPPFEMIAASLRGENNIWAGKARATAPTGCPRTSSRSSRRRPRSCTSPAAPRATSNTDVAEASVRLLDEAGVEFVHGPRRGVLRHPDEGRRQVGRVRGDLRAQHRRGEEARREDDRDLVPGVRARVEGDVRRPGAQARRRVRVRGEALLRDRRAGGRRRASSSSTTSRRRSSRSTTAATRAARRASTSRRGSMLKAIPGVELVEMEHNREEGLCCGSVLTLIGETPVAPVLGKHAPRRGRRRRRGDDRRAVPLLPGAAARLGRQERHRHAGRRPRPLRAEAAGSTSRARASTRWRCGATSTSSSTSCSRRTWRS